jgi:hypothetical protein
LRSEENLFEIISHLKSSWLILKGKLGGRSLAGVDGEADDRTGLLMVY